MHICKLAFFFIFHLAVPFVFDSLFHDFAGVSVRSVWSSAAVEAKLSWPELPPHVTDVAT